MAGLDIICIGAINYDYMFHCTGLDLVETSAGGGDENLSNPISDVENDIQELAIKGKEYTTQIGGSAFITLKVAKHILPNLQVEQGIAVFTANRPEKMNALNDLSWAEMNQFFTWADKAGRA